MHSLFLEKHLSRTRSDAWIIIVVLQGKLVKTAVEDALRDLKRRHEGSLQSKAEADLFTCMPYLAKSVAGKRYALPGAGDVLHPHYFVGILTTKQI